MDWCDFSGDNDFNFFQTRSNTRFDFTDNSPVDVDSLTIKDFNDFLDNCWTQDSNKPLRYNIGDDFDCYPKERCCGENLEKFLENDDLQGSLQKLKKTDDLFKDDLWYENSKKTSVRQTPVAVSPKDCCKEEQHEASPRHFLLQFTISGVAKDRTDQCYEAERNRCLDFWDYVQINPELDNAIKDGNFFHKGHLRPVECATEKSVDTPVKSDMPKPKYSPSMLELRKRNFEIREDERKRREKAHKRFTALQAKTGLKVKEEPPKFEKTNELRAPWSPPPRSCGGFADCTKSKVDDVMEEMDTFDKLSRNPVRGSCELRQKRRQNAECTIQALEELLDESMVEYTGEDEEENSSTDTAQMEDLDVFNSIYLQ